MRIPSLAQSEYMSMVGVATILSCSYDDDRTRHIRHIPHHAVAPVAPAARRRGGEDPVRQPDARRGYARGRTSLSFSRYGQHHQVRSVALSGVLLTRRNRTLGNGEAGISGNVRER